MATAIFDAMTTEKCNLLELAPIVENAIVSKPLLQLSTKVILFSMDAKQEISEHRAPFVATIHVLDGCLQFTVDGKAYELKVGDWLVIPNNHPHDLKAIEPTRFLLTMLKD